MPRLLTDTRDNLRPEPRAPRGRIALIIPALRIWARERRRLLGSPRILRDLPRRTRMRVQRLTIWH